MSADLTPRGLHYLDKTNRFSEGNLVITLKGQEPVTIYDSKSDVAKVFPNLSFLLNKRYFDNLLNSFPGEYLKEYEEALATIIEKDDSGVDVSYLIKESDIKEPLLTTCKWYLGELDKNFYYSELNSERFVANVKGRYYSEKDFKPLMVQLDTETRLFVSRFGEMPTDITIGEKLFDSLREYMKKHLVFGLKVNLKGEYTSLWGMKINVDKDNPYDLIIDNDKFALNLMNDKMDNHMKRKQRKR